MPTPSLYLPFVQRSVFFHFLPVLCTVCTGDGCFYEVHAPSIPTTFCAIVLQSSWQTCQPTTVEGGAVDEEGPALQANNRRTQKRGVMWWCHARSTHSFESPVATVLLRISVLYGTPVYGGLWSQPIVGMHTCCAFLYFVSGPHMYMSPSMATTHLSRATSLLVSHGRYPCGFALNRRIICCARP